LSLGFGEQPAALIRETIDSKTCLGSDCTNSCNSTITFLSVENISKNSLTVKFTDVSSTSQWKYRIVLMDGTVVQSGNTTEKNFTINNLLPGIFYRVEMAVDCSSTYQLSQMILTDNDWCGKTITDSGGSNANYTDGEYWVKILYPDNQNEKVKITFQEFDLQPSNDFLVVRNGPSADSPYFQTASHMTGTYIRGPFTSTHATGAITLVFKSDEAFNSAGFKAQVSCATLAVGDIDDFKNTSLFPNPVKNQFIINGIEKVISVKVFDSSGKLVKVFDLNSISKNSYDVSKLKNGNYIILIKTEKETLSKKLIKQ
jgi:hypothetical protein